MRKRPPARLNETGSVNSLLHCAIISSPFVTRQCLLTECMDADGIFVPYMPDTLHYAGVNVYSLRLVATDGRLQRRDTAPDCDKCRFTLFHPHELVSHPLAPVFL